MKPEPVNIRSVQITFLLGPAGSGKTFRCLSEIRDELERNPEGKPLIFLAPKQATFQLERQLLEGPGLRGYSRLQILSFERLARFVLREAGQAMPKFISDQGRIMVLRALLNRLEPQLEIFRGAARRHGFPEELSRQIREFSNHGLTPSALRQLAQQIHGRNGLPEKLRDFALIFEHFRDWLQSRGLQDSDALLGAAAGLLNEKKPVSIAGLWVDGFAQLTPEERKLMTALAGVCDRATLAFCIEQDQEVRSPISPWCLVSQTVAKCKTEMEARHRQPVSVKLLQRGEGPSRFEGSRPLRYLEARWGRLEAVENAVPCNGSVAVNECSDPEAEAACAAREIVRFVRGGGRWREAAVLVRDFNNDYPHVLRRVFRRYGIPFFLDHRENVAYHPLAELTRGALRTIAFDWEQRDWFTVLKSGLLDLPTEELDQMENAALAHGWRGPAWREGLKAPKDEELEAVMNQRRQEIMPPFLTLAQVLQNRPDGTALAEALRTFWNALRVQERLEGWSKESAESVLHATVWEQMNAWLEDLTLAFGGQPLQLRQWLPILEAGLSTLTVGVIPPVLDEVLIGAVDRSRNPDLKLLCILGFNEKVFPAIPADDRLLSDDDRTVLLEAGSDLVLAPALKLAAEQFYGYIACTRARERLRISYSRAGLDGGTLNPSRFLAQLERLFPDLEKISWRPPATVEEVVHDCELSMLAGYASGENPDLAAAEEKLAPEITQKLYGQNLSLAVSRLERFAACPFRFFAERGLRLKEREEFTLDIREQGSFQHAVLAEFHERVIREKKEWSDLKPEEGRAMIREIAEKQMAEFRGGLALANPEHRFAAETYQATLQDFIHALIEWFRETNDFRPAGVEFAFGLKSTVPGWKVDLSNGNSVTLEGRVDRIDLYRMNEREALCVIVDYKSGLQKPDRVLVHHGIQQQLSAYLVALTEIPEVAEQLGGGELRAAGGFLLPLGAHYDAIKTRNEAAKTAEDARRSAYTHNGFFDFAHLKQLDKAAGDGGSGQFYYALTKNGNPHGNSFTALESEEFDEVLARTKTMVRDFGERIYAGEIKVHPYKKGNQTACDQCRMLSVCRFDPQRQRYNVLRKP